MFILNYISSPLNIVDKVRRQPKAGKPKKMTKVEGYTIVNAACNNGTTALVTKDGELLMFGKDTTHSDPNTGIYSKLYYSLIPSFYIKMFWQIINKKYFKRITEGNVVIFPLILSLS